MEMMTGAGRAREVVDVVDVVDEGGGINLEEEEEEAAAGPSATVARRC